MSDFDTEEKLSDAECKIRQLEAEIDRLRSQLADSISRESVIATERDEARDCARMFYMVHVEGIPEDFERWEKQYPWLEGDDE